MRDGCGYRTALHMKEYEGKKPALVIGGTAQDFLGEYMAGGTVILLDLKCQGHRANLIGTGMHCGTIYLRGSVNRSQVSEQVEISPADQSDRGILDQYVSGFIERFPELELIPEEVLKDDFVKLTPRSKRPYSGLYTY